MGAVVRFDSSGVRTWVNATGADVAPGTIVKDLDGKAGIVTGSTPVKNGASRAINTDCEVDIDSASATTFSAGGKVTYVSSTGLADGTTPTTGTFYCGRARLAKVNGETKVTVLLNDPGPVT